MFSKGKLIVTVLSVMFLTLIFALPAFAQSVTLEVDPVGTAAEGQLVTLTATDANIPGVDVGDLEYRFAYRVSGTTKIYPQSVQTVPVWTITIPDGAANTYDLGVQVREAGTPGWSSPPVHDIFYGYVITEVADDPELNNDADLISLPVSYLTPDFDPDITNYTVEHEHHVSGVGVRPTLSDPNASLTINGEPHESGTIKTVSLNPPGEETIISIVVTAEDGVTTKEYIITVYRQPEVSEDHSISNIVFDPISPDTLEFDEYVNFTFDYSTTNPGNVQIWGRPMTEGSLSPNWGGHGSLQHSPPTGSASGFIRIRDNGQAEAQHVDQVRFRMVCVDTSDTLLEIYVDVDYTYIPPGFDHDFGTGRDGLEGWAFDGTWTQTHSQLHTDGENNKWSSAWYTVREYRNFEYTVVMRSGVSPGDRNQPQYIIIRAGEEFLGNGYWYPGYSFGYIHSVSNQYSVWKRNTNGTSTALRHFTNAAQIVDGWNTLKVRAVDNRFDFYINDTLVDTVFDSEFTVGKVGFAMYNDEGRFSVHRATLTVIED